ncbi:hypothetical protein H5410_046077 [Solanum commersonii]|uniref:Uncharacterized protein n=1 Tax=Solanum commersonii TaxID=4109 RepID=A0A9J5XB95_SOLCO|nr:hypothetical protein H5410_046077 [Solanum commersonii]
MNIAILSEVFVNLDQEVKYESYKSDTEVDIDVSWKNIEISYIVEGNSRLSMKIKNHTGVKLYLEVKK